jgi:subtilisin family serine protease
MSNKILHITKNIENFKPLLFKGEYVFKQQSKISNFLQSKLGNNFSNFFSEVSINNILQGNANWYCTNNANATLYDKLLDTQKSHIDSQIQSVFNLCNQLLQSTAPQEKDWGLLLQQALKIPNSNCIYLIDDNATLSLWGFENKRTLDFSDSLSVSLFHKFNTKPESSNTKSSNVNTEIKNEEDLVEKTEPTQIKEEANTSVTQQLNSEEKHGEEINGNQLANKIVPPIENKTSSEKKDDKKKNKIWLWLLALLLLLLLIIFLISKLFNHKTYLPDTPQKLIPIDSNKTGVSTDSVRNIATDRLNVALIGENTNINLFANKFKSIYSSDEFKIIYYDTLMHKLQLQIPASKRDVIANELKSKFKEFELLIYEESMFKHSKSPNDPALNDINKSWYEKRIQLPEAWDISEGDPSIVIAVIDDGFDLSHPEFQGKIYKPLNAYTRNTNVNTGLNSSHGTHVAGLAVANSNNNFGIAGAAPKCKLMPIQVGDYWGRMSTTAIIDGLLYAINNGANVVNMSLGMGMSSYLKYTPIETQRRYIDSYYKDEEQIWNQLYNLAYKKNVTIVLAAGNDDVLIGIDPMQRSQKVIKVSASDPYNRKASFSNFGNLSTISAPGVSIYSSIPRQSFTYMDGTSMAAPIVAGCIGLIKSVNPALSYYQTVDLIQSTGLPIYNGNRQVGNLIQMKKALEIASQNRKKTPIANCGDVQKRIDSLLQEIDKLRNSCLNNNNQTKDTLKIPSNPSNLGFASGKWKSTSYIYNVNSGVRVTLLFDINSSGRGKLSLIQSDNTVCDANINLSFSNNAMYVKQQNNFLCQPNSVGYKPYSFVCKADNNGCAVCEAQNMQVNNNRFTFNLVKIN